MSANSNIIIITSLFNAWQTAGWYTTASHRYERCWSGASRLPTARSSLQAAYSQHRPCGALVPAEDGPNFAAWWAGVHVCEQLTQGCYAVGLCLGRESNSRPSDRESRALTIEPPRHTSVRVLSSVVLRWPLLDVQCTSVCARQLLWAVRFWGEQSETLWTLLCCQVLQSYMSVNSLENRWTQAGLSRCWSLDWHFNTWLFQSAVFDKHFYNRWFILLSVLVMGSCNQMYLSSLCVWLPVFLR